MQDRAGLQLESVTAIRFEFRIQAKPGQFDGSRVLFTGGTVGELGAAACSADGQPPTRPAPPPPPAPAPAPATGEAPPCASYPEFMAFTSEVSTACCGDAGANCAGG